MLNNKDEILDTLDTIANDTGKATLTIHLNYGKQREIIHKEKENFKCLCMFIAKKKKEEEILGIKNNK